MVESLCLVFTGQRQNIGETRGETGRRLAGTLFNFLDGRQGAASSRGKLRLCKIECFAPPAQPGAKG